MGLATGCSVHHVSWKKEAVPIIFLYKENSLQTVISKLFVFKFFYMYLIYYRKYFIYIKLTLIASLARCYVPFNNVNGLRECLNKEQPVESPLGKSDKCLNIYVVKSY